MYKLNKQTVKIRLILAVLVFVVSVLTIVLNLFSGGGLINEARASHFPISFPCQAAFRTDNGSNYLVAQDGGGPGKTINANSSGIGSWETFTLENMGGGGIAFRTSGGYYAVAEGGGGGAFNADRGSPGSWETFFFVNMGEPDRIAITRTEFVNDWYVVAEGAGGGSTPDTTYQPGQGVNADRSSAGGWETFTLVPISGCVTPAPSADIVCNGSNSCTIPYNTSANLAWCGSGASACTNAASCSVAPGGWGGISNSVSTGNLLSTTNYTLTCDNGLGVTAQDQVTVTVGSPPLGHNFGLFRLPTLTASLTANPGTIVAGSPTNLQTAVGGTGASSATFYSLWWDCADTSNDVVAATSACGSLPSPAAGSCASNTVGYRCEDYIPPYPNPLNHIYSSSGVYRAKVIIAGGLAVPVEDFTFVTVDANPPSTPSISGPVSGFVDTDYTFTITSTDSQGAQLRYGIDWNMIGTVDEWLPASGYVNSGVSQNIVRNWPTLGARTFQVLAQNSFGVNSGWQSHTITINWIPTPTGLNSVCNVAGNQLTRSWDPVAGATSYLINLNFLANDNGGWFISDPPDISGYFITTTTDTVPVTPGASYNWWVHAVANGVYSPAAFSGTVVCSAVPPTVTNVTLTEPNYCTSGPGGQVSWTYSDPGLNAQNGYRVQVDNDSAFGSPEVDTCPSGAGCSGGVSTAYAISLGQLNFNIIYYSRVMVWNSVGTASGWANMSACSGPGCQAGNTSWRTPVHAWPNNRPSSYNPNWLPLNPGVGTPVQFTDRTSFDPASVGKAWSWVFNGGSPASFVGQVPPTVTYATTGSYNVTITSSDDAGSCTNNTTLINIQGAIPTWREIIPR